MQPSTLLDLVNQSHGTAFTLGERFSGGEQGAFAIIDHVGRIGVLKWYAGAEHLPRFRRAQAVAEHLRDRGYPIPRYLHLGLAEEGTYAVLEALPGAPLGAVTEAALPSLLALNDLQAGPAPLPPGDWPAPIIRSVLVGGDGFCLLDSLRTYSPVSAELLAQLQTLVRHQADIACATSDIVHFDFTPANVLVSDGRISGVIDWEGVCVGDRAFDLATLLFYAYERAAVRARLWPAVLARSGPAALVLYLAHLIVRQVDWSIRHHRRRTVDRWLRVAQAIVRDLPPRSRR